MATVSLPGGPTLNYREWGRPDAAVVLLLHGLTSSSQSWRHVAPELGEHFRVIAPDARGHGGSEWMRDYSFESMRDDVARFMEQVGILAAIVIGHSMGAVTAYDLARHSTRSDTAPRPRGDAATRSGHTAETDPTATRSGRRLRLEGFDRGESVAQRPAARLVGARPPDSSADPGPGRRAQRPSAGPHGGAEPAHPACEPSPP